MPFTKKKLFQFYNRSLVLTPMHGGGKRILVLAPHVDDETIGVGGTIIRHVQEGDKVTVVFVTDGSKSVSQLDKEKLILERKKEANQVKDLLGFQQIKFLDLPDGGVVSNQKSQGMLSNIIDELQPDILYCPTFVDCHPDHVATSKIVADVVRNQRYSFNIRLYEINCPIPPSEINTVIDITKQVSLKDKAIDIFASQAIDFDGFVELSYIKKHLLKNENEAQAVETFLEVPAHCYSQEYDSISNKKIPYNQVFKQVNKAATLLWGVMKNSSIKEELYKNRKEE